MAVFHRRNIARPSRATSPFPSADAASSVSLVTIVLYEAPMKNNHNKSQSSPWEVQASLLIKQKEEQSAISEKFTIIKSYATQRQARDDEYYDDLEGCSWQILERLERQYIAELKDTQDAYDISVIKSKLRQIWDALENYDPLQGRAGCRDNQREDANDERY